jgi:hypothetical protein
MAIKQRMRVRQEDVFPAGVGVRGEVEKVEDFDAIRAAKAENREPGDVQVRDKESGLRVWEVRVIDFDEDAPKGQGDVVVKIAAEVQPVPPPRVEGLPFRPVEFEDLTVTGWIDDRGNRPKLAWSFRAAGMHAPGAKPATPTPATSTTSKPASSSEKGAA